MDYLTKLDTGPNLGLNSGGSSYGELGPMTDPETGLPIDPTSPINAGSQVVTPIPGAQVPAPADQVAPVNMATIISTTKENWPMLLAAAGLVAAMISEGKTVRNIGIAAAGIGLFAQYLKNKQASQPAPIPQPTA